jgi:DNA-nicking Smr family endonuclease
MRGERLIVNGRWLIVERMAGLRWVLRQLLGVTPTLDLHGFGVREALEQTERYLRHAQAQGEPVVRIVYGKGHGSPGGRGVLREMVPRWLDGEGAVLITRYQREPDASGADGAVKVWLRPPGPRGRH